MNQYLIIHGETFLFSVISLIFLAFTFVLPRPNDNIKVKTMLYLRLYIVFGFFAHLFFGVRLFIEDMAVVSMWGYNILTLFMMYSLLYASLHRFAIKVSNPIRLICLAHFLLVTGMHLLIQVMQWPTYFKQVNVILGIAVILMFNYGIIRQQNQDRQLGENVFGFTILLCSVIVLVAAPLMLVSFEPTEAHFFFIVTLISIACSSLIMFGFAVSIIHSLVRRLRREMNTDRLTGVKNRNYFYDVAAQILAYGSQLHQSAAIIICDIDDFKQINDNYGHITGDLALVSFAECLQSKMPDENSVIRLGGEEFLLLLPDSSAETAMTMAENIRQAVCDIEIDTGMQTVAITASFGVMAIDPNRSVDDNISFADKALYKAKAMGKNQVVAFHPGMV
mgnify:CR=1 FL=1